MWGTHSYVPLWAFDQLALKFKMAATVCIPHDSWKHHPRTGGIKIVVSIYLFLFPEMPCELFKTSQNPECRDSDLHFKIGLIPGRTT